MTVMVIHKYSKLKFLNRSNTVKILRYKLNKER